MKIKFLIDYAGRETAMKGCFAGEVYDFPDSQALELIRLKIAEEEHEEVAEKPRRKVSK